jgi:crotonobetainyl-CoA:carnitine CoA-transferase CaiB-like acyl-CoA transferase
MKPLDVCFAPVNTLAEALADENALSRGMVLKDDKGRRFLGPAIKFLNEPARPSLKEPRLGQHTAEVLGGLQGGAKRV